jgi:hypothetical protein
LAPEEVLDPRLDGEQSRLDLEQRTAQRGRQAGDEGERFGVHRWPPEWGDFPSPFNGLWLTSVLQVELLWIEGRRGQGLAPSLAGRAAEALTYAAVFDSVVRRGFHSEAGTPVSGAVVRHAGTGRVCGKASW